MVIRSSITFLTPISFSFFLNKLAFVSIDLLNSGCKKQQLSHRDVQVPERIFTWSKTLHPDWLYSGLMRLPFLDVWDWVTVAHKRTLGYLDIADHSYNVRTLVYVLKGRGCVHVWLGFGSWGIINFFCLITFSFGVMYSGIERWVKEGLG